MQGEGRTERRRFWFVVICTFAEAIPVVGALCVSLSLRQRRWRRTSTVAKAYCYG